MKYPEKKNNPAGKGVCFRQALAPAVLVALAVAAIYGQSLWFGYVNYDDALVKGGGGHALGGLSWQGLREIFSLTAGGTYQPLRDLAFSVAYSLSGSRPWGCHMLNLLLYGANLLVVFFLFRKLLRLSPGLEDNGSAGLWAWAATMWFAVHPVHVEAVAWMVSNKELLAGLFFFLSLLSYMKVVEKGFSVGFYWASWAFLVLGLMSKPSVAALPLVVVAFELLYRGPGSDWKRVALRTAPFLALVAGAACYYVFSTSTFTGALLQGSLKVHFFTMASVLAKYVRIFLMPVNLSHSYPPPFFSGVYNCRLVLYLAVDIALLAGLLLCLRLKKNDLAFGLFFILLNLLPVSGVLPISIFMADRYLYLSSFGFVFVGVLLLIRLKSACGQRVRLRRMFVVSFSAAMVFLTTLSVVRCRAWKDGITLWSSAVRSYPNYQFNHYGLGDTLMDEGRFEEALEAFRKTNMFRENIKATYRMARIHDKLGDSLQAVECYRRVVELYTPEVDEPQIMAMTYHRLGMKEELAACWRKRGEATREAPKEALRIARNLFRLGYRADAVEVLDAAAARAPRSAGLRTALAAFQAVAGDSASALETIRAARAVGEDPVGLAVLEADIKFARGEHLSAANLYASVPLERLSPVRRERLAAAYFSSGRLPEALGLFRSLLDQASNAGSKAIAHNNLGVVLEALDSLDAAREHYSRALRLEPDYADALYNLGNVAAKQRKP